MIEAGLFMIGFLLWTYVLVGTIFGLGYLVIFHMKPEYVSAIATILELELEHLPFDVNKYTLSCMMFLAWPQVFRNRA